MSVPGGIKRVPELLFSSKAISQVLSVTVEDPQSLVAGLAKTHAEELRKFLRARVRNSADVPDIVQEVFLRMLRIPDQEAIRSPEAYLFTIAQHVVQQHALREATAPPSVEVTQMLTELQAAPDADPALQAHADQCLEGFERALHRLSPKVRATFILHRPYGLSLEQISTQLGISFPMAKKYLVKALFQFRHHLERAE
jgi:RNA polymerase sigma-70 factor (ECF subfamily)